MRLHLRAALLPLALAAPLVAADPEPVPLPLPAPGASGVARVADADEARKRLGLLPDYALGAGIKNVKVAVLDSGFAGIDGKRPYLPADAVLVEHYAPDFVRKFDLGDPDFIKPFRPGDSHGRQLAQIVWAATGGFPDGPKFYLLNANGPTLFRRAVRMAIELKVDVILFAGTFEGAGNYDGRGPINAAVDAATAAGVVWVNAAGNSGGMVFNGPVDVGPGGYVRFGAAGLTALRLKSRVDENAATLTLTWNDYRDAEDAGTEKDLDLIVEDATGAVVGESKLKQVAAGAAGEGQTKNPRERVVLTDLAATAPGKEYRVRVRANSANFGPRDRLRILLTPGRPPVADASTKRTEPSAELLDATRGGEIYPPADHPGVLTVGDPGQASAVGPTADGRTKPDVIVSESVVRFTNGDETSGASNAAAYFAGVVAVLRAAEPRLSAGDLRAWVRTLDAAGRAAPAPAAAGAPAAVPAPAPAVALTPNQLRALRFAEYALDERRRRGDPDPAVIVSSGAGEWVVRPGGRVTDRVPPVVPVGAAVPAPVAKPAGRADLVHVPWLTPTPAQLADLVRGAP